HAEMRQAGWPDPVLRGDGRFRSAVGRTLLVDVRADADRLQRMVQGGSGQPPRSYRARPSGPRRGSRAAARTNRRSGAASRGARGIRQGTHTTLGLAAGMNSLRNLGDILRLPALGERLAYVDLRPAQPVEFTAVELDRLIAAVARGLMRRG